MKKLVALIPVLCVFQLFGQESIRVIEFEIPAKEKYSLDSLGLISSIKIIYDINKVMVVSSDSTNTSILKNIELDTLNNTLTFTQASLTDSKIDIYYKVSRLSKTKVNAKVEYTDSEIYFKGYQYKYCTNHQESHACQIDKVQKCASQYGCIF